MAFAANLITPSSYCCVENNVALFWEFNLQFDKVDGMMAVHSMPHAFSAGECERIIAAIASSPVGDAMLVGHKRDHNLCNAELVWMDEVSGMGWVMERLIELVRRSNIDQFDFDLREFAESPQMSSYKASAMGHFVWHSDIGGGPTARRGFQTCCIELLNLQPATDIQRA